MTKILFTNFRIQKSFASGLNLTKVQLSSFSICFCRPTLYPISLSRWSNSSHSIANLYFGKYSSILYFPLPNWWMNHIITIWFKASCTFDAGKQCSIFMPKCFVPIRAFGLRQRIKNNFRSCPLNKTVYL